MVKGLYDSIEEKLLVAQMAFVLLTYSLVHRSIVDVLLKTHTKAFLGL